MQTTITARGQTVVPAELRRRYHIQEGHSIRVVPVPSDPVKALRGRGQGQRLLERLLADRSHES